MIFPSFLLPLPFLFFLFGQASGCTFHRAEGAFRTALAARKKPVPLIVLFAMHLAETLTIGRKVAKEKGVGAAEWIANCLAFGFTWWLPLRSE